VKIGGNLPGVHYVRDVADADSLVSSLVCSGNKFYSSLSSSRTDVLSFDMVTVF
jgi:hypothetical protein